MKSYINPPKEEWKDILKRPSLDSSEIENTVKSIMDNVKEHGDAAVLDYVRKFDNPEVSSLIVSEEEIDKAEALVDDELKSAIQLAKKNITKFHESQKDDLFVVETMYGVRCWRQSRAIEKVGLYIPGGTAPLFSTILMLAIPATIAGCKEIVLCTPEGKNGIHPAILYTAKLCGVNKFFKIGGAQAIAAMAYGTETVPQVYKLFGPGNQYVTMAKMLASMQGIAIDMPAGPSEVMVVADDSAYPEFIAADLLSQAEHGADSQAVLVTSSQKILEETEKELAKQLDLLPRKKFAEESLKYSRLICIEDKQALIDIINEYAAEHLILSIENAYAFSKSVESAGSIFLGNFSPESAGDYASGTNHTLPTNGFAKAFSGVSLDSFIKKVTFQEINEDGLKAIGPAIEAMAAAEQLDAHKNAVTVRLKKINE